MATAVLTGTLPATGSTAAVDVLAGWVTGAIYGTFVGTVALEVSVDLGVTWSAVTQGASSTAVSFTAPGTFQHREGGIAKYRLTFTRTSGTVSYRLRAET